MEISSVKELAERSRPLLRDAYGREDYWTEDGGYHTPAAWRAALAKSLYQEISAIEELPAAARFAFVDMVEPGKQAIEALAGQHAAEVLSTFAGRIRELERTEPGTVQALFSELRALFREQYDLRGRDVMFIVRSALTGTVEGPCLEVVVCLLGRRRCLERIQNQLSVLLEVRNDFVSI